VTYETILDKCWISIDELPLYNYRLLREKKDLTYLFKKKQDITREEEAQELNDLYTDLEFQLMDEIGVSDEFIEAFRIRNELRALEIRKEVNKDNSLNMFIKMKKRELESFRNNKEINLGKLLAQVNNYFKTTYREINISVREFYIQVELMNDTIKATNGR